jgi:hypothetical protein
VNPTLKSGHGSDADQDSVCLMVDASEIRWSSDDTPPLEYLDIDIAHLTRYELEEYAYQLRAECIFLRLIMRTAQAPLTSEERLDRLQSAIDRFAPRDVRGHRPDLVRAFRAEAGRLASTEWDAA